MEETIEETSSLQENPIQEEIEIKKRGWFKSTLIFTYNFIVLFFISTILQVIILRFVPPMYTPLMLIRSVENIFSGKPSTFLYKAKPLNEVSSNMQLALIASEDQKFPDHYGIDFKELKNAYKRNQKKKRIRGASTISQQVAKNVFLIPNRNYVRKALELYYTLLIETFWSKKKILETYLNVVEMGDGIYGAEAAAWYYFKKPASKLNNSEAAAIAAVLPNPRKYSVKNSSSYIWKRRSWISRQMNSLGKKYLEKL